MTIDQEKLVDNFYSYDFVGHLVEDDYNGGKNEVDFDAIDIIAEEDPSDESEQNESVNETMAKISD